MDKLTTTLRDAAIVARERAYAPYSKFKVGAAILTESDDIFVGCNVENVSYGLTICAERVAATAAVMAGHTKFKKVVVVVDGDGKDMSFCCGACRQFLSEFGYDMEVECGHTTDNDYNFVTAKLFEILPKAFLPKSLIKRQGDLEL